MIFANRDTLCSGFGDKSEIIEMVQVVKCISKYVIDDGTGSSIG